MKRLQEASFYIVDQGILDGDAWLPFAFEEIVMRRIGDKLLDPIVHIWRHRDAFIAGLRDRRLPYAAEALRELAASGTSTVVRNSGGAAVPLHAGVVNVSVILPKAKGTLDIYDDFAWMADWLTEVLAPLGVSFARGEVTGSYCPGDYDLSIGGRKFCGIAQRRQIAAYSLQAFLLTEGDGVRSGELARAFYTRASDGEADPGALDVEPAKMASLHELTGGRIDVERLLRSLHGWLHERSGRNGDHLLAAYEAEVRAQAELLRERYDR